VLPAILQFFSQGAVTLAHPKIQHELDLARKEVRRLRRARSCKEARKAWVSFLEHANRAINRLEGYAKKTSQIHKYKSLISKEIWDNDVTKFVRTARNAHEHGVQDTEIAAPFVERTAFPNGQIIGMTVMGLTTEGNHQIIPQTGPSKFQASAGVRRIKLKPTVSMVPVRDPKGNEIMPPDIQIETEDEPEVAAAARLYLDWVTARIATFS
jgi:hypothetical protein